MLIVQDCIDKRKDNPKNHNIRAQINIPTKTSTMYFFVNMNKYVNLKVQQYLERLGLTQQGTTEGHVGLPEKKRIEPEEPLNPK